ncbi:coiled-coil domain-containing protein 187 isoform X6 [Arvicanthis niloticus]|uniref:coiled-coil domain-containing protein 187 isoform X6 n=1 Tax=Arvicanthis niloticus TaxID=61156 RepID=UPI00402B247A
MTTLPMGELPTSVRATLQNCSRANQQEGLYSLKPMGRMAGWKNSIKPRSEVFHPHAAKDNLLATTLRWPTLSQQLSPPQTVPYVAWSDYIKEPSPYMKACSLPMWSPCLDTRDVDSTVSSGRMSGSSGGHESCTLFHGPWKERPPLVLGPQRQPRKSNPRLEQLRDKIRAQAQWQASCASLGTSAPSSASCFYKTSTMLQRKTPKVTNALPVPAFPGSGILRTAEHRGKDRASLSSRRELSKFPQHHTLVPRTNFKKIKNIPCKREISKSSILRRTAKGRDSELAGVYAWRKGQALVRQLLGPPPTLSRLQSKAPATELGSDRKEAVEASPAHTCLCKPKSAHSDQQVSKHTPSPAFHDQSATIQGAMETLQDLRQQIQAGLELARSPRVARKLSLSKPKLQNLAEKRNQELQSTQGMQGSFSKTAWTMAEGKNSSLGRAGNLHSRQHWKEAMAEQESCPQKTWTAQGQDTSFLRPGSNPEKPHSFSQRPWSALAWQTYPQRAWEAQGQDTSTLRSGSPLKKPSPFSQRPWSALAGQAYSACKDWEVFEPSPWNSLSRPHSALQDPWSNSSVQRSSPYSKSKSVPPSPKVKPAWPEPAQDFLQNKPAKEQVTPCPRPRGCLGQPHSSESLHDFMCQKAQALQQQATEQKALAAHTLELRNQRLQEVYRKQRESVLGKAIPVVSERRPGIVTFVPTQSGSMEAPGSLGSPLRKWSKVTSGMVLGDQEAPDSFCLCLNKPWNCAEIQDTGRPLEGYKQARLQALETMADVLKQRIDILTTKLHKPTLPDTVGDLTSDVMPLCPSPTPATPTLVPPSNLRTLMSKGGRETPQDMQAEPLLPRTYFQDGEMLPWSPSWELQNPNLGTHIESQPQGPVCSSPASVSQVVPHTQPCPAGSSSHGALSRGAIEGLEKKLQREMATLQALGACMRSSLGVPDAPDPTCGSLWQEEMPEVKKAGLVMPWTTRSCGQQEPERPHSGGLHDGHLTNFQLKSLSFLKSLKLDQQKQEQALALLRQRAEQEVWETQMALDELLFKHQLQRRMEKPPAQQGPEDTSKQKQQQLCSGPEPNTHSLHTMTTRSKSPLSQCRDSTEASKHLEEAKVVSAEPVQQDTSPSLLVLAKFHPSDRPTYQWNIARPEPEAEGSRDFHHVTTAILEQSLRDEELRAQYQTAVLRLRELALEEKACAELACLQHQMGCLGNVGHEAAQATLYEKQQQTFSRLENERKEIQHLRKVYLSLHRGRKQLLQHQQSVLNVQRSMALLQQELQVRALLLKSCSPRVKTAWEEVSEASQKMEGHRSGSPQSHHPQEISESSESAHLSPEKKEVTSPQTTSVADEYLQPLRLKQTDVTSGTRNPSMESGHDSQEPGKQPCVFFPGLLHLSSLDPGHQKNPTALATKKDGSSASQPKPQEAKKLLPLGDLQTSSATWAVERPLAATDSHAWSLHEQCGQSLSGDGPCPQEARMAENRTSQGLDVSRSSEEEPQEEAHWQSEEQRGDDCHQENPDICSAHLEAEQKAVSPAVPVACEAEAQPACHLDSPPCQSAAILDLCSETASSNSSGSAEGPALSLTHSVGSASSLSCSSLQEFQKATATLVQLSNSSTSLSSLEAEDTLLHADSRWSRELSAHDSWEEPGRPLFWGLHWGLPQQEGVPGNVGQVTLQRLEGGGARLLSGFSEEVAVAAGLEPDFSSCQSAWPLPFPRAPSPRLGSELSESSSQIWEENSENLVKPSACVEPDSGNSLLANGSLDLEGNGGPNTSPTSLGPGGEQEASRIHKSLSDTLNTGKAKQMSPVATFTVFPPQSPSTSDVTLSLSVLLDMSFSEGTGLSKVNMPTEASAGCQEEPQDADTSPSMQRKSPQASPDPKAATTLQAPSESGTPQVTEVASHSCVGGFLTEILSPVDEELSYGSRDLTSSIHRVTHLLPPPPPPQAKSDISEPNPSSDFPTPPEEVMFSGDSLDTLGEDTSITAEGMSSSSEEALEKALSLGPQKSGHCLGAPGQAGGLDDSNSTSPLSNWVVSAPGRSPRLPTQLLSSSPVACVAREDLEASDSQGGPWEGVQCFESAEQQQGIESILDRRAATSSPSWSAPSEGPPSGPGSLVPSGQAESLKHTSEEKAGQSCWTEGQPKLQDLLDIKQLPRRDWALYPVSEGACAGLLGTGDAGPVDVVSTQLSRRILCDSLAALAGLIPEDNP